MSEDFTNPGSNQNGKSTEENHCLVDIRVAAATMAHEINRVYCQHLGDNSQVPWGEAPEWQRQSALMGVMAVVDNPLITPAQQHLCWMDAKKAEGWVYGKEKDAEKKTHPCMVLYAELPPEQQFKDTLFGTAVRTMFRSVVG